MKRNIHFAAVVSLLSGGTVAAGLNDTGVTFCGDAASNTAVCATVAADGGSYPRQDARYGRDAAAAAGQLTKVGGGEAGFDFTALDAGGQPTTPTTGANPHPCVRDNVTGLVWEVKTDDNGLRDKDWTYSWYDSVHNYGGNPGTANGGNCYNKYDATNNPSGNQCDTAGFVSSVNAVALCGFSDWRMPSVKELMSITHLGRTNPSIDSSYFPNTVSLDFWSSTPNPANTSYAWFAHFGQGVVGGSDGRWNTHYVRLVRGSQ